jgi:hypothetical protein
MDEPTRFPQELTPLQFDHAEPMEGRTGGVAEDFPFVCAACSMPLRGSYYEVNGKPACEACRYQAEQAHAAGPGAEGFFRAAAAGLGAAAGGCGLYYAIREVTGYEIGRVAILVGVMVGGAVRWGTRRKGGRVYQLLAVFLTYMAISCTYLPAFFKAFQEQWAKKESTAATRQAAEPAPVAPEKPGAGAILLALGALFLVAAAGPVVVGMKSPILLLIVGFGLWEAWKMNRRAPLQITGPLEIGGRARAAAAPAG